MTTLTKTAALLAVILSILLAATITAAADGDRIEGVVKETRTVAGRTYASVSVGSDDSVRRDMRLSVVNRKRELLGSITVTQVDKEEAIGVLSGARINEIRSDDHVTNAGGGENDDGRIMTSLQRP
jgi:hypothetical protein